MNETTEPDGVDTPEQKAYRRGKAAGYSVGVVAGWDACKEHMEMAFKHAMASSLVEPSEVERHRRVVAAQGDREQEKDVA